ncbi:LIC10604 family protein [Chryseolinea soli]|uniref:Polyketide cyclase n=1 Tax=Chryseolinea soli TaxID=2321403 RepID=A0A385SUA1_9BACT|nr:SRPBCC family protein [Chryseolinea soli]AYB33555.1 polyketide cyclase [Chryseolinea soli]
MKWIIIILFAIVVVVAIIFLIGYFMPIKHQATVRQTFNAVAPLQLWQVITTPKDYAQWRRDLKNLEVIDDLHWKETSEHGDVIAYEGQVIKETEVFMTKIATKGLPFGGTWTFTLKAVDGGTELTITENGEVYNPLFRFMSKFVFGHDATLKTYLKNLNHHLTK